MLVGGDPGKTDEVPRDKGNKKKTVERLFEKLGV